MELIAPKRGESRTKRNINILTSAFINVQFMIRFSFQDKYVCTKRAVLYTKKTNAGEQDK